MRYISSRIAERQTTRHI